MSFSEQLIKLRLNKNITQTELANNLNIKQYVVSSWETGRSEPNINQLISLSDYFEVPIDFLLDKEIIRAASDKEFKNAFKFIEKDKEDEFIKTINKLCGNLTDQKKQKILEIIQASLEL